MSDGCGACGGDVDEHGRSIPAAQPDGWTNPAVAVDALCSRGGENGPQVLMVTRGQEPWKGMLALPGGFVDYGEDPEDAVLRELSEETGIPGQLIALLCVRGDPTRDPRKHIVSIVYHVIVDPDSEPVAGDDAAAASWYDLTELIGKADEMVAFDHRAILTEFAAML